jgi:hypothetical protein
MKRLTVLGIDPGTVNPAWCQLKFVGDTVTPTLWEKKSFIPKGGDSYAKLYDALEQWWEDHAGFPEADVIRVEKQMKKKMIAVEAWIKGKDKRVQITDPRVWRNYFGVGTGTYCSNKMMSVVVMKPMLDAFHPKELVKADLAEAYMIALHGGRVKGFAGVDDYGISKRLPANGYKKTRSSTKESTLPKPTTSTST